MACNRVTAILCRIVDVQSVLFCGSFFVLLTSRHYLGLWKHRNKDSLDPRHFGTSAKVSGQFCPNAETLQTISLDTSVLRPGQCQRVQLLQFMAQHCWDSALIIFYRIHTSQATHMLAMCALRKILPHKQISLSTLLHFSLFKIKVRYLAVRLLTDISQICLRELLNFMQGPGVLHYVRCMCTSPRYVKSAQYRHRM